VPAKPAPRPAPPKLATREPPPPPATPAQLRAEDMAPVPATLDEIRTWARRFGIRYDGSNADAVNKERRRLGLPPLVQVEAKGRAA
jgi:hypothetical protein